MAGNVESTKSKTIGLSGQLASEDTGDRSGMAEIIDLPFISDMGGGNATTPGVFIGGLMICLGVALAIGRRDRSG